MLSRNIQNMTRLLIGFTFIILLSIVGCKNNCADYENECDILDLPDQDTLIATVPVIISWGQSNMATARQGTAPNEVYVFENETGFEPARTNNNNIAVVFAELLSIERDTPVYVINVGVSGAWLCETDNVTPDFSIDSNDELMDSLVNKIENAKLELGGIHTSFEYIGMWMQGESDSQDCTCAQNYVNNENCMFNELREQIGFSFPIVSYEISEYSDNEKYIFESNINDQKRINALVNKNVFVLENSNFSTLDGIHLDSLGKQQAAEKALEVLTN